ncbi:hypothetical protein MUO65_02175 [bacterium]|nr:hypothetical protein [bacterium]
MLGNAAMVNVVKVIAEILTIEKLVTPYVSCLKLNFLINFGDTYGTLCFLEDNL